MPRPKGKPTTHVRLSRKLLSEIKEFQNKKGIANFEEALILYLSVNKDWKRAQIERKEKIEGKIKKEWSERLKRTVEDYVNKINELGNKVNELENENSSLKEQNVKIPQLESDIRSLKAEIEKLSSAKIMNENIGMKDKIVALTKSLEEYERKEERIRSIELLLKDYERLKEETSQIPELRNVLSSQAKEIKFMRDNIVGDLDRILKMESLLDVRPALITLKDGIIKKADFELEKYEESFKGVFA